MRAPALLLALAYCAVPVVHAAAVSPPGMNLRWDRCYVDGGAANKVFACDTNVGSERLAMSFELAGPLPNVIAITSRVTLASASPTLPAWWAFLTAGSCRQTALSYGTVAPPGSVNCIDWAAGGGVGGVASYIVTYTGLPNTRQVTAVMAVPLAGAANLFAGTEYAVGSLDISHAKTVGTGACVGCATPVCLLFSDIEIETLDANGNPGPRARLTKGANYSGSAIASWQNSYILGSFPPGFNSAGIFFPAVITQCVPYDVTASRPSTWGQVKALYR